MIRLYVNGRLHEVDVEPDMPLLWVLRDVLGLAGTKYGCGIAQCGACTVHVDGAPMRSCALPACTAGKSITTIEGLASEGTLHPVQRAWLELDVPQCGYCQTGMIMAVAALLKDNPRPSDAEIDSAITNICRCGTYQRVRAAIHAAARGCGDRERNRAVSHHAGGPLSIVAHFLASVAAAGGALRSASACRPAPASAGRRRDHCLDRDRAGRHRHHPRRQGRDGARHLHRAADAGGGGAGMRLEQGDGGIRRSA